MATWLWRRSRTVLRVMPAGRGVTVVKTDRLDMVLFVSPCKEWREKRDEVILIEGE